MPAPRAAQGRTGAQLPVSRGNMDGKQFEQAGMGIGEAAPQLRAHRSVAAHAFVIADKALRSVATATPFIFPLGVPTLG